MSPSSTLARRLLVCIVLSVALEGAWAAGTADDCPEPAPTGDDISTCKSVDSGSAGGQSWYLWSSNVNRDCIVRHGTAGAFKVSWQAPEDILAGVGKSWSPTVDWRQAAPVSAAFRWTRSGTAGGFSMVGVHGWAQDPPVEFYVVEDWFSAPPVVSGSQVGVYNLDGGAYKIYKYLRQTGLAIVGSSFYQYFSVRQTARNCGTIDLSEHFRRWDSLGMPLARLHDARVSVEATGGTGLVEFAAARVEGGPTTEIVSQAPLPTAATGGAILVSLDGRIRRGLVLEAGASSASMLEGLPRGIYLLRATGGRTVRRVVVP